MLDPSSHNFSFSQQQQAIRRAASSKLVMPLQVPHLPTRIESNVAAFMSQQRLSRMHDLFPNATRISMPPPKQLPSLAPRVSDKFRPEPSEKGTVSYIEPVGVGKRQVRHVLNFDSPRTQKAAAELGVTLEDCVKKPYAAFCKPGIPEKVAQLRYSYHCSRAQSTGEKVYTLRKELIQREEQHKGNSQEVSKTLLASTSPGPKTKEPLRMMTSEQKQDKGKLKLLPTQKRRIKDYIQRSWQDLVEVEKGQTQRGEERGIDKTKKSRASTSSKFQTVQSATPSDNYSPGAAMPRPFSNVKEAIRNELSTQVMRRVEERIKTVKRMELAGELIEERRARQLAEMELAQSKLRALEQKLRKAESNTETQNAKKVKTAFKSCQNVSEVKEKAEVFSTVAKLKQEASYMKKADKIEESKRHKTRYLNATQRSIREKFESKKRRQLERFELRKKAEQDAIASLAESLKQSEMKHTKVATQQKETHEERLYWEELARLKAVTREENLTRLGRMQEYKRSKILNQHATFSAKHSSQERMYQTCQCSIRSQKVREQMEQEAAYARLEAMLRVPKDKSARKKLAAMFQELNNNLGLGLRLKAGVKTATKKEKQTSEDEDVDTAIL